MMLMGNFIADIAQINAELSSDIVMMSLSPGNCRVVLQLEFQGLESFLYGHQHL